MNIYIIEFCNNLGFKNKKDNRWARMRVVDNRNRISNEFVISRNGLPKDSKPGDKLEFINITKGASDIMSAADSVKLGPLTASWQRVWDLWDANYRAAGIPTIEKFCRTLNLEAPSTNTGIVYWSRTSIGDNPAGELNVGDSILKQTGGYLNNENTYNLYVKGNGQYLYAERSQ